MTSFAEKAHENLVVVRDSSIVSPEFGTQANPIVIGDDLAPLDSASNPIVIYVDEDHFGSDVDTEIITTPEFWETLISGDFAIPADEGEAIVLYENPEDLQSSKQSSLDCFHLDNKALKVAESSFYTLQNCSGLVAASSEKRAKYGERQGFEAEEPREARHSPEASMMTRTAVPQETTD
ncbi:uncharacterized protein N7458_000013 [Penicillium daleae]|uniref:Uncharacterized protein n=1 Tax=Penicillium daleae TaxID=63821 RepID=A0AAD6CFI6_9EURO|nr:uncharacterized protein N7458_000013 [Penicillium daleae]KAJ5464327.1 hypothetical protein N7458_000013 [Penicillium daleae]